MEPDSHPIYYESCGRAKRFRAARLGAKFGVLSVVPAAVVGTSVAIVTTSTVTSTNTIVTGLLAGVATFAVCTSAGVAVGAVVGVAVSGLVAWRRRRRRDKELNLLIKGEFV